MLRVAYFVPHCTENYLVLYGFGGKFLSPVEADGSSMLSMCHSQAERTDVVMCLKLLCLTGKWSHTCVVSYCSMTV